MNSWSSELDELEKYLISIKGQVQSLEKELESLLKASEDVTALLFARRSLEVIIIDLCDKALKRPRGTEPLQSIVDKLSKEEHIPDSIHTSMCNLIRIANFAAHPKEFDPRQVRGALINLSVVVQWFISYNKNSGNGIEEINIVNETAIEPAIDREPVKGLKLTKKKLKALELLQNAKELIKKKQFDTAMEILKTASELDDENDEIIDLIIETSKFQYKINSKNKFSTYTDPRDGHVYKIVRIGAQVWFAENLAYIPHVSPPLVQGGIWVNDYAGTEVAEAKKTNYYKEYGCLYDWRTATNRSKPVCPPDCHLPSDDEWKILMDYLGKEELAGAKLKSIYGWENPNTGATNETGFSGLPGGSRDKRGVLNYIGDYGLWWTSSQESLTEAWYWYLFSLDSKLSRHSYNKEYGFSIRCLLDSD